MADPGGNGQPGIDRSEHLSVASGENIDAKRVAAYGWDATNLQWARNPVSPSLVDAQYDYISVAYPVSTTEVYTFKAGGSGGTTVATVTVVYTNSTKENLSSVTRS